MPVARFDKFPLLLCRLEVEIHLDVADVHRQQLCVAVADAAAGILVDLDKSSVLVVDEQRIGDGVVRQRVEREQAGCDSPVREVIPFQPLCKQNPTTDQ